MATSKSTEARKKEKWTASALVFSGRQDPTWEIEPRIVQGLQNIWRSLKPASTELPAQRDSQSYRGAFVRDSGGREWVAFGGVVVSRAKAKSETRLDPERRFERTVLASAPEGALPPWAQVV